MQNRTADLEPGQARVTLYELGLSSYKSGDISHSRERVLLDSALVFDFDRRILPVWRRFFIWFDGFVAHSW